MDIHGSEEVQVQSSILVVMPILTVWPDAGTVMEFPPSMEIEGAMSFVQAMRPVIAAITAAICSVLAFIDIKKTALPAGPFFKDKGNTPI